MIFLLVFAAVFVVSVLVMAVMVYRAPLGWEDRYGFHHGRQPPAVAAPPARRRIVRPRERTGRGAL